MKKYYKTFIRDKKAMFLGITGLLMALFNSIFVLLNTDFDESQVPIRFNQYENDILLGKWHTTYEYIVFILIATIINIGLSIRLHRDRRGISLTILLFNSIVMLFAFFVIRAIFGLN